jgi:hypothetical protein
VERDVEVGPEMKSDVVSRYVFPLAVVVSGIASVPVPTLSDGASVEPLLHALGRAAPAAKQMLSATFDI